MFYYVIKIPAGQILCIRPYVLLYIFSNGMHGFGNFAMFWMRYVTFENKIMRNMPFAFGVNSYYFTPLSDAQLAMSYVFLF